MSIFSIFKLFREMALVRSSSLLNRLFLRKAGIRVLIRVITSLILKDSFLLVEITLKKRLKMIVSIIITNALQECNNNIKDEIDENYQRRTIKFFKSGCG